MPIESTIDPGSEEFRANAARMRALADELAKRRAEAAEGGPPRARERHVARGKLLPRERVDAAARSRLAVPRAVAARRQRHVRRRDPRRRASITGIGRVEGRECVIVCNDATVKGGTYYPMTVKKHLRAQEIARENRLPCIYLVDSGGANLPHQAEVFPDREHFGRIFYNQATMSARRHPADRRGDGLVHRGRRLRAGDGDETIIVQGQGTIFLGGPPLVKAATGEVVTAEELGGADVHTRKSGVADHYGRGRRARAGARARASSRNLNTKKNVDIAADARRASRSTTAAELDGIVPGDTAQAIRRARGHRAAGRRLRVRRVQGALRHDAGHRLRAHLTASRSASSPTTASCSRRAR